MWRLRGDEVDEEEGEEVAEVYVTKAPGSGLLPPHKNAMNKF